MAERIHSGVVVADEMLIVMGETAPQAEDGVGVKAAVIFESLIAKFWDTDTNDLHQAWGTLVAQGLAYLTFDRKVALTPQGKEKFAQLTAA